MSLTGIFPEKRLGAATNIPPPIVHNANAPINTAAGFPDGNAETHEGLGRRSRFLVGFDMPREVDLSLAGALAPVALEFGFVLEVLYLPIALYLFVPRPGRACAMAWGGFGTARGGCHR